MECNIKTLRIKNNLTQRQLAVLLNTSEAHLSRIENGYHLPSLPMAYKMAKALNCLIEELYTFEE